jgi:hypothetical protein
MLVTSTATVKTIPFTAIGLAPWFFLLECWACCGMESGPGRGIAFTTRYLAEVTA